MDIEEVKDNVVNGYRMPHPQHCSQELYVRLYIYVLLYMIIWICITLRKISIDFELDILMQKIFSMIDWLIV